jgi:predicted transposase/invertase (TIGR01784 family)
MESPQPDRYVSLLTDFGFKRVFGTEPNKHLLMDFLNTLLPDYHQIRNLTFKNSENLGSTEIDRKAIFDIYCEAQNGERFIVEKQSRISSSIGVCTMPVSPFKNRHLKENGAMS